jgi:hypothetical protein
MTDIQSGYVDRRYVLVRWRGGSLLDLDTFARSAGLHPELVRRLVTLGLLEGDRDAAGRWWLPARELATAARIQRLRSGLSLNYAAVGLVMDLLDRIEALEAALRRSHRHPPGTSPSPRTTVTATSTVPTR